MEAGEIAVDSDDEILVGTSYTLANPTTHLAKDEPFDSHGFESPAKKRKIVADNQSAQEKAKSAAVSNCYVFKSRLQEYCQKAGFTTPVYETIKEGPSHEPFFKSTVIVNNERYDSLPSFFNRKAAEQSAAEVALVELANSADMKFGISQPVQETGLCKNVLQEYAQKMNYAIPLYECHKVENPGMTSAYSCVVEIGGIKYIGALANTKKEAVIKAARTAMIAIQSSDSNFEDRTSNSLYTVLPQKKKSSNNGISTTIKKDSTKVGPPKKKKGGSKRRVFKKRKSGHVFLEAKTNGGDGLGSDGVKIGNTCISDDCDTILKSS
ncbi:Double-stranded RNA-binding protein 1 [Striga hermonthica]|uniref:Double-stranded RNA-binding protein 1 n=1 Tax=Striga hermonthica TaxID=68872 RepID=A0A9N7N2B7_STRHE|nr:Double-stranded RNA-binding protein 1 [Striga hermonthica]